MPLELCTYYVQDEWSQKASQVPPHSSDLSFPKTAFLSPGSHGGLGEGVSVTCARTGKEVRTESLPSQSSVNGSFLKPLWTEYGCVSLALSSLASTREMNILGSPLLSLGETPPRPLLFQQQVCKQIDGVTDATGSCVPSVGLSGQQGALT